MKKKKLVGKTEAKRNRSAGAKAKAAERSVVPPVKLLTPDVPECTASAAADAGAEDELAGRLPFPVVALGASAGGLDVFTRIFQQLPVDTGMAFVLIQHLAPEHESMLAPLLSRATAMPVEEVRNGIEVQANHVYVIPPNKRMRISRGVLTLEPRRKSGGAPKPIDYFFVSLAESQRSGAIGVVLTGTDNDGTLGIQAIKAEGGIVIAQDERSAAFKDMPRNAIATGQVDMSLPPEEIAAQLARIGRDPYLRVESVRGEGKPDPVWIACRNRIFAILRNATGVDFQHYKANTVRRRLHRRMVINHCESLESYMAMLGTTPVEVRALHDDLLINVTGFFRDPEVYQAIQNDLMPRLLAARNADTPIRIWVPGCSTGEEAYSLAMCLFDLLEQQGMAASVQIFGTDVNDSSIARARAAVYSEEHVLRLPQERVRRFFVKLEGGYQIEPRVRESCVFARHNLLSDPPFSRLDLVSCRNVLIYLQPAVHQKIISTFHYSLKPDGLLILGKSESILSSSEEFALLDKQNKFYVRTGGTDAAGAPPRPPRTRAQVAPPVLEAAGRAPGWLSQNLQQAVNRLIATGYGPPGVVVNSRMEVVQTHGNISPFLQISSGAASLGILRLATPSLKVPLRTLLTKLIRENAPQSNEVRIAVDGGRRAIRLAAYPIPLLDGGDARFLLLFQSPGTASGEDPSALVPPEPDPALLAPPIQAHPHGALEALLAERDTALQELTAAHEEVQSANEELQSANEELQSANEELQTAKEELQATNEELTTLNDELQDRNLELGRLGDDLKNLLSSMTLPTVMLDNELRIRRFTPAAEKIMNLRPGDIGRPFADIRTNLIIEDFEPVLRDVLQTLNTKETELQDRAGKWHLVRVRPYRTSDNRIEGLVLLVIDITELKQAEAILKRERLRLEREVMEGTRELARSSKILAKEKKGRQEVEGALQHSREALDFSRARMRLLAGELLHAQDGERSRVSRELHDDLSQKLVLVEFNLHRLEQQPPSSQAELQARLEAVRNQIGDFSLDLRRIAYKLHPSTLDHLGLAVTLRALAAEFSRREGIPVKVACRNMSLSLPPDVGASIYRIAQEALRNVAKHAGRGTKVSISVGRSQAGLRLLVRDDGAGFDPEQLKDGRGLGLISMQERARLLNGTFTVTSKPGQGVQIAVHIPLAEEKQR